MLAETSSTVTLTADEPKRVPVPADAFARARFAGVFRLADVRGCFFDVLPVRFAFAMQ